MRLLNDVIYRLPKRDQSRTNYAIDVRKTLNQMYDGHVTTFNLCMNG